MPLHVAYSAVSKMEAAMLISGMDDFSDVMAQATIAEYIEENTPKTPAVKAPVKAKTPAVKAKTPAKANAKVATTEGMDENIPF